MTESEVAIPSCNANGDAREESNAQPSRTRDSVTAGNGEPEFVTVRNRSWHRPPASREGPEASAKSRTPFTEDRASPACVWRDYRDSARHFGGNSPLLAAAYWAFALPPFLLHMGSSLAAIWTEHPARGYGAVAFTLIVLALAGVL